VGAVSNVNMVLENNGNDINRVFGPNSDEAKESDSDRTNDVVGIAVHCADKGCSTVGSGVPATGSRAKPELGGQGIAALYGHTYVACQVSPIAQTDGTAITGFNQAAGFNPTPATKLTALGQRHKQLNAPVGEFGMQAIQTNTDAIRGDAATYQRLETRLKAQVAARDGVVNAIQHELDKIPGCGGSGSSTPGRDAPVSRSMWATWTTCGARPTT
jgi:hypothetical protein